MTGERLHSLPLITYVFQMPVLVLWLIGSVLTWLVLFTEPATISFYLSASMAILFAVGFFNYGLDVVEYTARGHASAPPLSEALTGSGIRLFRQCFVILMAVSLVETTPVEYRWVTMSLLLGIAPAVSSSIVFHAPLMQALNPVRIYQFMSNMGFGYLALRLMTTTVLLLALYVASQEISMAQSGEGRVVIAALTVLAVLMMFRGTGALLHVYREKLGIQTEFSEEQAEAIVSEARLQNAMEKLGHIKLVFKTQGTKSAMLLLDQELKRHKYRDDPIFFELLDGMSDRRLFYRFCSGYIDRMVADEVSHAWALFVRLCEETNGEFRLRSGSTLFKLAKTAEKPVERRHLARLFDRFDHDFPQHPKKRQAAIQAANLALLLNDPVSARQHLERSDAIEGEDDPILYQQVLSQIV